MKLVCWSEHFRGRVSFGLIDEVNGKRFYALPVTMNEVEPGGIIEPCFSLERFQSEQLTNVMDELWSIGARPSDYKSKDHYASISAHLDDMRKIVFDHYLIKNGPLK